MAHILAVHHEPALLRALGRVLSSLGHRVTSASTSAEALQVLRTRASVRIVLTADLMPGSEGVHWLEVLREAAPHHPLVAVTGRSIVEPARKAFADTWVHLPATMGHMASVVRNHTKTHDGNAETSLF